MELVLKGTPVIGPMVFPSQDYESIYLPLPRAPPAPLLLFLVFPLARCAVS